MCGILGNYLKKTIKNSSVLHDSIQLLTHRGPDDSGVFQCDQYGIGLAHTRLSILDLSQSGHQPIFSADGQVVMVYNGEIYNFLQLREELQRKGYQFHGSSDTEVLLNLYLDQGENLTEKINGIFAFAIWDLRKESLFIARDGMGVKPLYYSVSDMGFSFASEVKALLKLDTSDNHLDHDSLSRYLTFLWCPGEGTPLKSVKKLNGLSILN